MKHGKQNDAKRRKLDKDDANNRGSRGANKSDDKQRMQKKKNAKFGGDAKFSGGKAKTNADKSNIKGSSGATDSKKKLKKPKPKKSKGKKKSHRNKNKWDGMCKYICYWTLFKRVEFNKWLYEFVLLHWIELFCFHSLWCWVILRTHFGNSRMSWNNRQWRDKVSHITLSLECGLTWNDAEWLVFIKFFNCFHINWTCSLLNGLKFDEM